jgi:hypothetical protein
MKKLGILKLEDLYKSQISNLIYDCHHDSSPESLSKLFFRNDTLQERSSRSQVQNPYNISNTSPCSKPGPVRKSSLLETGPEMWNNLPDSITTSETKTQFKARIKQFLLSQYNCPTHCSYSHFTDIEFCYHISEEN